MPLNPSNTLRAVKVPSSTTKRPASSSGAPRTKTVSSILGGGAAHGSSSSGQLSTQESHWFDKYHKLYEEHMQVKQERKDQDHRLTEITTKFRRITRDLKLSGFNETEATAAAGEVLAPYQREIHQLKERLAAVTIERDNARGEASELRRLLGMRPSGHHGSNSATFTGQHGNARSSSQPGLASGSHNIQKDGGIVDVTALLNQRHHDQQQQQRTGTPSSTLQQQQQQQSNNNNNNSNANYVSPQEVQKLRNTLHEEISKNERLSQNCENLRAQLAVVSNSAPNNNNNNVRVTPSSNVTPYQSPSRVLNNNNNNNIQNQPANPNVNSNYHHQLHQQQQDEINRLREDNNQLQREKGSLQQEVNSIRQYQQQSQQQFDNNNNITRLSPQPSTMMAMNNNNNSNNNMKNIVPGPSPSSVNPAFSSSQQQQQQQQNNATLQQLSQDLSVQVSHLSQRLEHSQNQVQTLRGECERLLQELKQGHNDVTQARQRAFEAEQETSTLRVKAARNEELESALALKTNELLRCENELLRLVDKLQSCARETESQVRLEYSARLSDVDSLRDEAERNRRSRERELFSAQQDLSDARRDIESKKSEIEHLSREVIRLQKMTEDLLNGQQRDRVQSVRDASDAQLVHQAVVMMNSNPSNGNNNNINSNNNMNMNNPNGSSRINQFSSNEDIAGGNWNEKWELAQLREQASQAILEREMAEQRVSDFETALNRKNNLMQEMLDERDQLLFENLELRRRLNGVQTCFNRAFNNPFSGGGGGGGGLPSVRDDKNTNNTLVRASSPNSLNTPFAAIVVSLTSISLVGSPGLHIASLDGIEGFECGISDPFAVLADGSPTGPSVELPFRFSNIPLDERTLALLRECYLNLQIHQVRDGVKSALVAIARMPAGQSIAACLETGSTNSKVELLGGDGRSIGAANVTISVDSAALPLALLPPIDAKASASVRLGFASASADPDVIRSLLLRMRSVRGVRIQIVRCNGLRNQSDPNRIPSPYVFYTSSLERSPTGSEWPLAYIVADTAVHTRTRAVTCDPVFDCEPKDFIFRVFDQQVVAFFRHAKLSFVVYDMNCEDPEQHLGMASVSLAPMLESANATMIENDVSLGQYGKISFVISWIR